MKRLFLSILFLFAVVTVRAEFRVYCEVVRSAGTTAILKFGSIEYEIDKGNKRICRFNTVVDALNFMSEHGWTLEEVYIVPNKEFAAERTFLLSKPVESIEAYKEEIVRNYLEPRRFLLGDKESGE